MALVNYMGDAPGFMSYSREPRLDVTNIPQRAKPVQSTAKQEDFDFDAKGNPGDKQFVYDQQKEFNSKVQSLYSKYGGEMAWVQSDPEYKKAIQDTRWAIYDRDAAEQNEIEAVDRDANLRNKESGQHDNDIELTMDETGDLVPKYGSIKTGYATKGDFLHKVISEPQLTERQDGSVGIESVRFDTGTGKQKDFTDFMTTILTDGHIGMNRNAGSLSTSQSQDVKSGLDFATSFAQEKGWDNSDNIQQINDATDYLLKYGFNDSEEYYLKQAFYKNAKDQREFKMPKLDEKGNIVKDAKGKAIIEKVFATDADLADPNKRKMLFNYYVQDQVIDFAEKFKQKSREASASTSTTTRNIDPNTGQVIEDPSLRRWESVVQGFGPAGPGFVKTETYPGTIVGGKLVGKEHDLVVYDASNFAPGIEQAKQAIIGKSLGDIDNSGVVNIGKKWQSLHPSLKGMQISDVQSVRQVPSKTGKGVDWVARVLVVADNDETFKATKYWDPEEGKAKDMFTGTIFQDISDYADEHKFGGYMLKSDVKNKGYKINGDSEETSWRDMADDEVSYMWVDVPVDNQMLGWDQYGVGETRKAEGEDIEIGANVSGVNQQKQKASLKLTGKHKSSF